MGGAASSAQIRDSPSSDGGWPDQAALWGLAGWKTGGQASQAQDWHENTELPAPPPAT